MPVRRGSMEAVVFGVWAFQSLLLLFYATHFGPNLPIQDDFVWVQYIHEQPGDHWPTYWKRFNEHRFPVVMVALVAIEELTGSDLRLHYPINALVLMIATFIPLWVLRRLRGGSSIFDLVFPLSGLSLTHDISVLMVLGLFFITYFLLFTLFLCAVAARFWRGGTWFGVYAVALVMLPVNGAMGLSAAAPMTLYSAAVAIGLWRREGKDDRRRGVLLGLATLGAGALAGVYISAAESVTVDGHPDPVFGFKALLTAFRAVSMTAGKAVISPGLQAPHLVHAFGGVLLALPVWASWRGWRRKPQARPEIAGYAAIAAGTCLVALAIGVGRAGFNSLLAGLQPQYSLLFLPLLFATYRLAEVGTGPKTFRAVAVFLLMISLIAAIPSGVLGWEYGRQRREVGIAFRQKVESGYPLDRLVEEYRTGLFATSLESLPEILETLKEAELGPFGTRKMFLAGETPAPEFRPLELGPQRLRALNQNPSLKLAQAGSSWVVETANPQAALAMGDPEVYGTGPVTVRIEMLSPVSTICRLVALTSSGRASAETLVRELPVEVGRNLLEFRFEPGQLPGAELRFQPGRVPARYRLVGVGVLEHPVRR